MSIEQFLNILRTSCFRFIESPPSPDENEKKLRSSMSSGSPKKNIYTFLQTHFSQLCPLEVQHSEKKSIFNKGKVIKMACDFNPDWVQNGSCKVKLINRDIQEVSVKGFLLKPMNNFWVHFKSYKFYNVYRPFITSYSINLCNYYKKNAHKDIMLTSAIEVLHIFSNMNHSCPYQGWIIFDKARHMRNLSRLLIPAGKYKGVVKLSDGIDKNDVAKLQLFLEITENTD